jgi:hypothetical protein
MGLFRDLLNDNFLIDWILLILGIDEYQMRIFYEIE